MNLQKVNTSFLLIEIVAHPFSLETDITNSDNKERRIKEALDKFWEISKAINGEKKKKKITSTQNGTLRLLFNFKSNSYAN